MRKTQVTPSISTFLALLFHNRLWRRAGAPLAAAGCLIRILQRLLLRPIKSPSTRELLHLRLIPANPVNLDLQYRAKCLKNLLLPPGSPIISPTGYGASIWTRTAWIDIEVATDKFRKAYLLKACR